MRTTKHFIVMLLCALLYVPMAPAQQVQEKHNDAQSNNGTSATTDQKSGRAVATVTGDRKSELRNDNISGAVAATAGTTGRIAKFISATELGDSVITELNGNVGIGMSSPGTKLTVQTATSSFGIVHTDGEAVVSTFVGTGTSATTNGGWLGTVSNHDLRFFTANGPARMTIGTTGNVGIGTPNPGIRLTVQTATSSYGISHTDGDAVLATFVGTGNSTTTKGGWLGTFSNHDLRFFTANGPARMTIGTTGNVGIGTLTPQTRLDVVGITRTNVLQITGGSDLAEPFAITAAEATKPGMVVGIDPQRPGRLRVADKAYDRTAAGIVSGANGINPGLTMKQEGTAADGSLLVALTGRVYCWADASYAPIEPGDLLTTSDTPGHAMKVTDYAKARGAIIGKAMTELKKGKGLVLVLVTLQ